MKKLICTFLAVLLCFSLSGCGSASMGEKSSNSYSQDTATETAPGAASDGESPNLQLKETNRKLIYTSDIRAETKDFDTSKAAVDALISQYEGYLEASSFSGYSRGDEREDRSLNYTIRVPAEALSDFLAELESAVRVTSGDTRMEDVTGSYVDTEARLTALREEESRLLELLGQAETLDEILQLEDRLSNVRYEIESMTSQLQVYDDEIAYSTVNLSLQDVTEYAIRPSFGSRSWDAFTGGWSSFVNVLQGVAIALLWMLPFLLTGGVIVFLSVFFTRRARKKRRARFPVPPAGPAPMASPPAAGSVPAAAPPVAPAFKEEEEKKE